jgi:hypothetical protein
VRKVTSDYMYYKGENDFSWWCQRELGKVVNSSLLFLIANSGVVRTGRFSQLTNDYTFYPVTIDFNSVGNL